MMETQTNNHYSISTIYGLGSRELDERCKEHVTLLLPWRPLVQLNPLGSTAKFISGMQKDQEKIEEGGKKKRQHILPLCSHSHQHQRRLPLRCEIRCSLLVSLLLEHFRMNISQAFVAPRLEGLTVALTINNQGLFRIEK